MPEKVAIAESVPLAPFTTFQVGGPARYFAAVKTRTELLNALTQARRNRWPVFVLAGGSNLIVSSSGFDGLVIHILIDSFAIEETTLCSGASTSMSELVDTSINHSLAGLEWAGGLPGSLGGAIRGNAGAFGGEMKDVVESVTSLNVATGLETTRSTNDCQFEYRGSFFKHHPEIIVSATLRLKPGDQKELRQIADSRIKYRQEKHPMTLPNAGSIFKNTPLENVPEKFLPLFHDAIKDDPFPIVPTAKILAVAELAGTRVGGAELSTKHTNYIVNTGTATAEDIVTLIKKIQTAIQERYGIKLEVEPEIVGF